MNLSLTQDQDSLLPSLQLPWCRVYPPQRLKRTGFQISLWCIFEYNQEENIWNILPKSSSTNIMVISLNITSPLGPHFGDQCKRYLWRKYCKNKVPWLEIYNNDARHKETNQTQKLSGIPLAGFYVWFIVKQTSSGQNDKLSSFNVYNDWRRNLLTNLLRFFKLSNQW